MPEKKLGEEAIIRNLTRIAELSSDRQISQITGRKGVLKFRFGYLGGLGKRMASAWDNLLPLHGLRVKRTVSKIRPSFARAINLLHQRIRDLMNASEPKHQRIALDRSELLLRALTQAAEGLMNQVEIYQLAPEKKEAIGGLVLEVIRDTAASFDRPDTTAGVFRTLSQPGDEGKNLHSLSLLCRSWKRLIVFAEGLKAAKAVPQKQVKILEEAKRHLESFLHKAYLLIWSKPIPLASGTLYQTPVQADRNQAILEGLDRVATPVKILASVFGDWHHIPAFHINGKPLAPHGEGKVGDYRNLCHTLLNGFNDHCVVPASDNVIERQAQVLTDYVRHATELEDNEKTNAGLIDYPAPEAMGKLFTALQPLVLGGEQFLSHLLGNLAKPVPFEAEALSQPPWSVKVWLTSKEIRVSQQRDFIIEDFMGDPILYLTAESTVRRPPGGLWDYDGARALEVCFRRSASDKQKAFLMEGLPLSDEDKRMVLEAIQES